MCAREQHTLVDVFFLWDLCFFGFVALMFAGCLTWWLLGYHCRRGRLPRVEEPGAFERQSWEISLKEKAENIPLLKEAGNVLFKQHKVCGSVECIVYAAQCLWQCCMSISPMPDHTIDVGACVEQHLTRRFIV